jgi:NNP family nitrate/nitrite transporter-like MFS transporter
LNNILDHDSSVRGKGGASSSFRSQVGSLLFLAAMFLINFLARIILAPLLPIIEKDMGIGHEEAGSLFLLISSGVCGMLLCSGFISSRLTHRRTIILSSLAVGGMLLIVSLSTSFWGMRLGLFVMGVAAGLYMPSGVATVTSLVRSRDWGKALAIHELAPSLGFVSAPLFAEALMRLYSWRCVLAALGGISIIAGLVFAFFGKGGRFPGEAPRPGTLYGLLSEPSFWIMIALFSLGTSASMGVYTMLPLYLVSGLGMERGWANTMVSLSRISGLGMALLAGWLTDRLGPKRAMRYSFTATGVMTVLLGAAPGSWIVPIVFLQPMLAACFFPPGFTALSRIGSPRVQNVAVSFTLPFSLFLGTGGIPATIGIMGEAGLFAQGFALVGGLLFSSLILLRYLKFRDE